MHDYNIPIPKTLGINLDNSELNPNKQYIHRPYRHRSGHHFRVINHLDIAQIETGYISEVFPKQWEYRLIYIKGELALTLLKRAPKHLQPHDPWNHTNGAYFVTVQNPSNNRMRHTNALQILEQTPITQYAHLIAYDILLSHDYNWVVTEANFCPSLTIDNNLAHIGCKIRENF